jgi:hypothetical protein
MKLAFWFPKEKRCYALSNAFAEMALQRVALKTG